MSGQPYDVVMANAARAALESERRLGKFAAGLRIGVFPEVDVQRCSIVITSQLGRHQVAARWSDTTERVLAMKQSDFYHLIYKKVREELLPDVVYWVDKPWRRRAHRARQVAAFFWRKLFKKRRRNSKLSDLPTS